jgi:uncharacterized membrane protein YfcA
MSFNEFLAFMAVGALVGIASGMLGIGGGVLVIPLLVMIFHFNQKTAVGTSLAMLLPPIGIFAVFHYYHAGLVRVQPAVALAVGFALGAWGGAHLVGFISERLLRVMFALFLLYVAGNGFPPRAPGMGGFELDRPGRRLRPGLCLAPHAWAAVGKALISWRSLHSPPGRSPAGGL